MGHGVWGIETWIKDMGMGIETWDMGY